MVKTGNDVGGCSCVEGNVLRIKDVCGLKSGLFLVMDAYCKMDCSK